MLVGSFVIWNTFNVLVAQRRREVALLRAVGATRRQVLAGVLVEAAVIGLVSGGIGLLLGVGLAAGIRSPARADRRRDPHHLSGRRDPHRRGRRWPWGCW